ATSGVDYVLAPGKLVFNPGEMVKSIPLTITNDSLSEADETVLIKLTSSRDVRAASSLLSYTILNDDAAPQVRFAQATSSGTEGRAGSVQVELSAASGQPVSVRYTVTGGTAAGADYKPTSGTLTFKPGQTVLPLALPVVNDRLSEGGETVVLTLSDPAN